jgi:hypothetical protein
MKALYLYIMYKPNVSLLTKFQVFKELNSNYESTLHYIYIRYLRSLNFRWPFKELI